MNGAPDISDWDVYMCEVEGRPASILVDLALAEHAPLKNLPVLGHVGVALQRPDENGFPDAAEYDELAALEDALIKALVEQGQAVYAGRSIRDGESDFFFYLPDMQGFGDAVEKAFCAALEQKKGGNTPGPDWESGSVHDADWDVYRDFLFPNTYDLLGIQNRRALAKLQSMGDDPALTRFVEHWLEFATEDALQAAAQGARAKGFAVHRESLPAKSADWDNNSGSSENAYAPGDAPGDAPGNIFGGVSGNISGNMAGSGPINALTHAALNPAELLPESESPDMALRLSRPDTLEHIDEVVFFLASLALEHGGSYQGWTCPVTQK